MWSIRQEMRHLQVHRIKIRKIVRLEITLVLTGRATLSAGVSKTVDPAEKEEVTKGQALSFEA